MSVHGHFENWKSRIDKIERVNGHEAATCSDRLESYPDDDLPSAEFINRNILSIEEININDILKEISYIPASRDCHGIINPHNPFVAFDLIDEKLKVKIRSMGRSFPLLIISLIILDMNKPSSSN